MASNPPAPITCPHQLEVAGKRTLNQSFMFSMRSRAIMVIGQNEEAAFVVFSCNHVIVTSQHIGHLPSCKKKILNE